MLYEHFKPVEGRLMFAVHKECKATEDMDDFLNESIKNGCEGLMVKTLYDNASYEPSKRSLNWLKLKKDYINGIGDSVDLVPIGGYTGKGKRTGVYGAYLLACYDPDDDEYQSICKIGTGFSDELLNSLSQTMNNHIIARPGINYNFDSSLEPDVWFDTAIVWEVKAADLSISPIHKAAVGVVDPEKGIALRFPRFVRVREDKTPENATSSTQIVDLYKSQAIISNNQGDLSD